MATDASHLGSARVRLFNVFAHLSVWNLLPIAAFAVFGTLFIRHISALDGALIWAALSALAPWQWVVALTFTALSFRAIGTYDVLVHAVLQTGQSPKAARSAGTKAFALSQTLGFGALTGALVRWRCLPDLALGKILRLSAVVSLSFLAALAVVAAIVVPLSGIASGLASGLGTPHTGASNMTVILAGVGAVAALAVLARLAFHLGWIPAPISGASLIALLLATAADTAFAAAALWALWPQAVSYDLLFAAYLVALGAGLLSNAPGGVGAFDLSLLAMLPVSDDAAAMAAILAFRIIYYALPAAIALIGLIRPVASAPTAAIDHPEAALLMQSARLFHHPKGLVLRVPCWRGGAVLGDLPAFMDVSNMGANAPKTLYKCGSNQAIQARQSGWSVLRCAQDALITPATWTADRPACRQLRRALRQFETSGLRISRVRDMQSLRPVACAWAATHGRERGLSMGRYCPQYLLRQQVFAAFDGATPVAFVSFHTGAIWTLDLMRHVDDLPAGTMQALVCAGIAAAKDASAAQVSLACVPAPAPSFPFAKQIAAKSAGLCRFKAAFGPQWQPRYICSTGPITLVLAMMSLAFRIHFPPKISPPRADTNFIHTDHEDYSFAPAHAPCEAHSLANGAIPHDQRPLRPAFNT